MHVDVEIQLFRHVDMEKNMPTTALVLWSCLGNNPGGRHSTFFSGRGVRPRFLKCGACERKFASEKGGVS